MDTCRCGAQLVRYRVWRRMTDAEREQARAEGKARAGGHGLCSRCHAHDVRNGVRFESDRMTQNLVLVDWQWLHETGQLSELDPLKVRVRVAAPRMGMTAEALAKALHRAGVRNPVEPSLDMHHRVNECRACNLRQRAVDAAERDVWQVSRMLERTPDSMRLAARLEAAREWLARMKAQQEWHHDTEHEVAA